MALLKAVKAHDNAAVQKLLFSHYDKHICETNKE
jgi:hypothetical protein